MIVQSISAKRSIAWGDTAVHVYEDHEVFSAPGEDAVPTCPCCKGNPPPHNVPCLNTLGIIEQRGFWDTVMIAVVHCGWCNGDFAVRQFSDGVFETNEESQSVFPIGGLPDFSINTLKKESSWRGQS